jgi:hypothetical protein
VFDVAKSTGAVAYDTFPAPSRSPMTASCAASMRFSRSMGSATRRSTRSR